MSRAPADRLDGFALIESLAVLALSALVVLTLVIAADLVTRNSAAASRRVNEMEALATGLAALSRDIATAKHIPIGSLDGPLLFHGGPASLGFVGGGGEDRAAGDSLIWMAASYEDDRGLLVRSAAPLLPQTADFAAAPFDDPTAVLTGPWTYRFSYAAGAAPLTWTENWSIPQKMPQLIRVEVLERNTGERVVPPLVTRIHVDSAPGCPEAEDGICTGQPAAPADGEQPNAATEL